ncbi:MAG: glycosyltransferase family 2 protein [Caldilinea sp. CFX5]|nr:glycosyltransferase family 2 protein [Caldilinea sp. CFX5]
MATVSIIIVSFNTAALLRACLQNLANLQEAEEVIVVDNASGDGSAQVVQNEFPWVKLIRLSENRGLTVASNVGLAAAQGDYILYLGSDAYPKAGVIQGIKTYLEAHPTVGIATAELRMRDGNLDMDAHRGFPTPWASLTHFSGLNRLFPRSARLNQYFLGDRDLNQPHEIDLCISHFLFTPRSLFAVVGKWDEDFFLYGEDVDFCYRVKAAGYKIMYLPQFTVTHYKGASVGVRKQTSDISQASTETKLRATHLSTKAMMLFYQKHMQQHYPWLVNATVLTAIRFLGALRLQRAKAKLKNATPLAAPTEKLGY